jgi:hypothetical protein
MRSRAVRFQSPHTDRVTAASHSHLLLRYSAYRLQQDSHLLGGAICGILPLLCDQFCPYVA